MDIKEIALKVADSLRNKVDGVSHMQSNQGLVRFAEALIESYKAELLKEVVEPVACRYKDHNGHWCFMGKQYANNDPLFTSDQVAAAIIKATKPLEDQLAAAQEEWNQCSGLLNDAHRSIEMLEDQLATAEQRVAELEAENAKLHEQVDLQVPKMAFTQLKGQLAAEQLNNKLLREALEFLDSRIVTMDLGGVVERALSLLASTEALDEYVAEKVKEATLPVADELQKTRLQMITDFGQYQESHEQVATLTSQRDLAVEALRVAAEQIRKCDYTPARSTLLVAIKESEAMAQGEKKGV